jgi:hypothetical protein
VTLTVQTGERLKTDNYSDLRINCRESLASVAAISPNLLQISPARFVAHPHCGPAQFCHDPGKDPIRPRVRLFCTGRNVVDVDDSLLAPRWL